jgi:hypothetical protein
MSVEAITWALKQPIPVSSAKFVLVVLANHANEENLAYPSIAYLVSATGQNRKTVMLNLERLCEWGVIERTDRRIGRSGQINVYNIKCEPTLFDPGKPSKKPKNGTGPKLGTGPKSGTGPVPKTVLDRSQNRDTEPSLTALNQKKSRFAKPPKATAKPRSERLKETLVWLDQQLASGLMSNDKHADEVCKAREISERAA